ncbi:MAG: tetratricopeptide repeat protein [Ignavibacteria bacterium]|nr:tetratricopeptide repeat protein [Ignavibacteria bacterium]
MKKALLLLLFILVPAVLSAQRMYYSQRMIDSLDRIVVTMPSDTAKVNILNTLARATVMTGQLSIARGYAAQALKLSTTLRWKPGIAMSYNRIGNSYSYTGQNRDSAYLFSSKALQLWQELGDKRNMALIYSNLSSQTLDTADARNYAFQSLKYAEELGDSNSISRARHSIVTYYFLRMNDLSTARMHGEYALSFITSSEETITAIMRYEIMGLIYMRQQAYAKSLQCYFKIVDLAAKYGDTASVFRSRTALTLTNTGLIYFYLKQYAKALEYHERALVVRKEMKDTASVLSIMSTICEIYKMMPDDTRTLDYCNKTLRFIAAMNRSQTPWEEVLVYRVFADVYRRQKQYVSAIFYGKKAFDMARQIDEKTEISYSQKELGLCLLALALDSTGTKVQSTRHTDSAAHRAVFDAFVPRGTTAQLRLAQDILEQSLGIAENSTYALNDVMEECYPGLITTTTLLGDYKSAVLYYGKYVNLKDSTYSAENNNSISLLEMRQSEENLRKQEQISSLEIEKVSNEKKLTIAGLVFTLLLALILYNRFRIKKNANIALEEKNQIISEEKEKSDSLLLNILPAEVAEELKAKGTADAKHFDNVTVLFTDFKSFTTISETLTPQELVGELHTCFKAFDEICTKYSIEKIKTIGDAYLAVCGLPLADEKHAENVVKAALEIREFMAQRGKELGAKTFEIRIGINSGSVVAGIVGVKKFAYDIWGDTVNTAARMEQNSEPGKINISETTYALVKNQFTCDYRGEIDAKNKGKLKMYFVDAEKN